MAFINMFGSTLGASTAWGHGRERGEARVSAWALTPSTTAAARARARTHDGLRLRRRTQGGGQVQGGEEVGRLGTGERGVQRAEGSASNGGARLAEGPPQPGGQAGGLQRDGRKAAKFKPAAPSLEMLLASDYGDGMDAITVDAAAQALERLLGQGR